MRRAPRGARGLKSTLVKRDVQLFMSCPSRGTWIEIGDHLWMGLGRKPVVPLAGHVD